ncbi:hypothetical protein R3P38DRAFT_2805803 [Favolaschia claudopus]|uniref:Uncharacterized protein n=1 Tax=Favolaschia claudopus TaxID=2862362 RepID=A0AAV9ZLD3_9AGAR
MTMKFQNQKSSNGTRAAACQRNGQDRKQLEKGVRVITRYTKQDWKKQYFEAGKAESRKINEKKGGNGCCACAKVQVIEEADMIAGSGPAEVRDGRGKDVLEINERVSGVNQSREDVSGQPCTNTIDRAWGCEHERKPEQDRDGHRWKQKEGKTSRRKSQRLSGVCGGETASDRERCKGPGKALKIACNANREKRVRVPKQTQIRKHEVRSAMCCSSDGKAASRVLERDRAASEKIEGGEHNKNPKNVEKQTRLGLEAESSSGMTNHSRATVGVLGPDACRHDNPSSKAEEKMKEGKERGCIRSRSGSIQVRDVDRSFESRQNFMGNQSKQGPAAILDDRTQERCSSRKCET